MNDITILDLWERQPKREWQLVAQDTKDDITDAYRRLREVSFNTQLPFKNIWYIFNVGLTLWEILVQSRSIFVPQGSVYTNVPP